MGQVIHMFGQECSTPADEHEEVSTDGELIPDGMADALWALKGAVDEVFEADTPRERSKALAEVKRLAKALTNEGQ